MTSTTTNQQKQQTAVVRKNIHEISQKFETGLSAEVLDICIKLCEVGAHPTALADVVNQIRKEYANVEDSDKG